MNLHSAQPVATRGTRLTEARAAMILLHGRGSSAENILSLVTDLLHPEFAYLAPQAAGYTWYPFGFMEPLERNEPHLSSALSVVDQVVKHVTSAAIPARRLMLLGFSQGACLTLEYAARHAMRYGGVVGLSGGVIGPDGTPRDYSGAFGGVPVFLGCSDIDLHIPVARVEETAAIFTRMGASVTKRFYPGLGHTINLDELEFVRAMMDDVLKA